MARAEREAAERRLQDLVELIRRSSTEGGYTAEVMEEAEALSRAIAAFHLEGIRFRFYNLDRMVAQSPVPLPPEAAEILSDVRRHLEAAGFHTRSHSL